MAADVSIVIPVYNRAALVGQAIDSCLAQASASLAVQVIAVDDGSIDDSVRILRGYGERIRLIALERNHGRNRARNTGLAAASGDYVAFLDSDDVLIDGALQAEVAAARRESADLVVAGWDVVFLDAPGTPQHFEPPVFEAGPDAIIDGLLAGRAAPTGAALYARELLADLRWDEALRKLDDWDWFVRAALHARRIATARVSAYQWRQHAGQGIRGESLLGNAIEHHAILDKLEQWLRANGRLTPARSRRLAQYFYKELRMLSLYDRTRFEAAAGHIAQLDPSFVPCDEERQPLMRWLARVAGFRNAVLAHTAVKRSVRRLQGRPLA